MYLSEKKNHIGVQPKSHNLSFSIACGWSAGGGDEARSGAANTYGVSRLVAEHENRVLHPGSHEGRVDRMITLFGLCSSPMRGQRNSSCCIPRSERGKKIVVIRFSAVFHLIPTWKAGENDAHE